MSVLLVAEHFAEERGRLCRNQLRLTRALHQHKESLDRLVETGLNAAHLFELVVAPFVQAAKQQLLHHSKVESRLHAEVEVVEVGQELDASLRLLLHLVEVVGDDFFVGQSAELLHLGE